MAKQTTTKKNDTPAEVSSSKIMRLMFATIADTTWRLFVPSIGGTVLGLWIDNTFDTKPWFTILGVSLGSIAAFMLVYAQIKQVQNSKEKQR